MSDSFTEVKEQATIQIIAQLHAMTEEETRAFISKLLDMLGYEQVLALHFAYAMTPNQPRGTLEAQEQAPIDLVPLREELIALTDLRARVVKENDTLSRIFAAYRKDETPVPTWDELNRAEKALESKVPGFHVWYIAQEKIYTLLPDLEYQPRVSFYTCNACQQPIPYSEAVFFDLQAYHKEHVPGKEQQS